MEIFEPTKFNFEIESSSSNWIFQTGELKKLSADSQGKSPPNKKQQWVFFMKQHLRFGFINLELHLV